MTIGGFRSFLYWMARVLGDLQAVSSGRPEKVAQRLWRRILGRLTSRVLWGRRW
ncbi:MAG: hypothetical protein ACUVS3_12120 [Thermodesulfobacteriota bacterium]